jgi:hypothetical protein
VDPQQLITLIPNPVVRNLLQGLKYLVIQESRAGTQVGADLGGTGHVYRDICGRFVLQACAIFCIGPRVTEGFYTSQRTHLYGGCGLGGEQVILNWDSDSTFKPGGNINNCPYGE